MPDGAEDEDIEESVGLQVDPSRVLVQSPGAGPGRVLSFAPPAQEGDDDAENPTQETTVEISEGFEQTVATADAVDVAAPEGSDVETMTLPVEAEIEAAEEPVGETEVAADRQVQIQVGTPTHSDSSLTEDLASAAGFTMGLRGDNNGQTTTVQLAAPVDATDEGRATTESALMKMISIPVVFPDEPIGPGAVWSVDSRVTGEATLLQTTTYTLNEVSGDQLDLEVSVTQRPALGALSLEGQDGVAEDEAGTLNVLNSNTNSQGSLTVDLNQPLPTAGRVSYTTRVVYGGEDSDVRVLQDSTSVLDFG